MVDCVYVYSSAVLPPALNTLVELLEEASASSPFMSTVCAERFLRIQVLHLRACHCRPEDATQRSSGARTRLAVTHARRGAQPNRRPFVPDGELRQRRVHRV